MNKISNIEKIIDALEDIKELIDEDTAMSVDSKEDLLAAIENVLDVADDATDADDDEDYDSEDEEDSDEDR